VYCPENVEVVNVSEHINAFYQGNLKPVEIRVIDILEADKQGNG
jgi:hypothetical protein